MDKKVAVIAVAVVVVIAAVAAVVIVNGSHNQSSDNPTYKLTRLSGEGSPTYTSQISVSMSGTLHGQSYSIDLGTLYSPLLSKDVPDTNAMLVFSSSTAELLYDGSEGDSVLPVFVFGNVYYPLDLSMSGVSSYTVEVAEGKIIVKFTATSNVGLIANSTTTKHYIMDKLTPVDGVQFDYVLQKDGSTKDLIKEDMKTGDTATMLLQKNVKSYLRITLKDAWTFTGYDSDTKTFTMTDGANTRTVQISVDAESYSILNPSDQTHLYIQLGMCPSDAPIIKDYHVSVVLSE